MKGIAVCVAILVLVSCVGCGDFQPAANEIVVIVPNTYRGVVRITEDKDHRSPENRADHFVIDESGACIAADASLLFGWHKIKAFLPDGQRFPSDTDPGGVENNAIAVRGVGSGHDSKGRRYAALVVGTRVDADKWYDVHNRERPNNIERVPTRPPSVSPRPDASPSIALRSEKSSTAIAGSDRRRCCGRRLWR